MASKIRKSISPTLEAEILQDCRRRCCLCFFLKSDLDVKKGQIAHLDKNRENNAKSNLVWLCLECHDQFDSSTRQSKNFTKIEVRNYRDKLLSIFQDEDHNISNSIFEDNKYYLTRALEGQEHRKVVTSSKNISKIIKSYDQETLRINTNYKASGIELASLALKCAKEKGDLFAAEVAYCHLIKLGISTMKDSYSGAISQISDSSCSAHPLRSTLNLIRELSEVDSSLFNIFDWVSHQSIITYRSEIKKKSWEDVEFSLEGDYITLLHYTILTSKRFSNEEKRVSTCAIGALFFALASIIWLRDGNITEHPGEVEREFFGRRLESQTSDSCRLSFINCAYWIALLPEESYKRIYSFIEEHEIIKGVRVNPDSSGVLENAIDEIYSSMMCLNRRLYLFLVASEESDAFILRDSLEKMQPMFKSVKDKSLKYLNLERRLVSESNQEKPTYQPVEKVLTHLRFVKRATGNQDHRMFETRDGG